MAPHERKAVGFLILLAGLWIVAAMARPGTTFHLAPLLVAGAPPAVMAIDSRRGRPWPRLLVVAGLGLGASLAITLVLAAASRLQGPSLLPVGGAVMEASVFAALGTAGGILFAVAAERSR